MRKLHIWEIFLSLMLLSCNNSSEEKQTDSEILIKSQQETIEKLNSKIEDQNLKNLEIEKSELKVKTELNKVRLDELLKKLNETYEHLEASKSQMNKTTSFKIGRSKEARDIEIRFVESTIKQWEDSIIILEKEIKKINPKFGSH